MTDPTRHLLTTLHAMATLAAGRRDVPGWRRMWAAAVADAAARELAALGAGEAVDPAQLRIPLPDPPGIPTERLEHLQAVLDAARALRALVRAIRQRDRRAVGESYVALLRHLEGH